MAEDENEGLAYDSPDNYCKEYNKDCEKCPRHVYSGTFGYGCNCGLYRRAFVDGAKQFKRIILNIISNTIKNE